MRAGKQGIVTQQLTMQTFAMFDAKRGKGFVMIRMTVMRNSRHRGGYTSKKCSQNERSQYVAEQYFHNSISIES